MYKKYLKRLFDILISLSALLILSPVFIILALVIRLDSKGPLIFKQKRVGINKKLFNIYKFRSMRVDAPKDSATHLLKNPDQYITRVGNFIRKTSLDELPQLLNILRGDMSLVGPRPALYNQYDLIEKRDEVNVNSIRPGLTGLAQVSGRDELDLDSKVKYDAIYKETYGFLFDIKILFLTLKKVLTKEGIKEGA